ncbi:MAG: hypothetical protein IPM06_18760 [Rhizobiales bacterium]|nr:hypothetical protein [Hyphomicrobiales bacterium]
MDPRVVLIISIADNIVSSGKMDKMQVPAPFRSQAEWAVHLAKLRVSKFEGILAGIEF